jgi:hypothetical protein
MRKSGVGFFILVSLSSAGVSGSAHAQNFFEMLFGGGQPAQVAAPNGGARSHHRPLKHARHTGPKKLSYAEAMTPSRAPFKHECCSSPQEALEKVASDATLRPGDAFMASDGLRVYVGESKSAQKFVAVEHAKIGESLRARLSAFEKAPATANSTGADKKVDLAARPNLPRTTPHKERLITTSEGKTIRLVGGYVN